MDEVERRNVKFNETNWDMATSFVRLPQRIFRTVYRVPFSINHFNHLKAGGFIERAMWKHTRFMLDAFFLSKQNLGDHAEHAYKKALNALMDISKHTSQAGFPDVKKFLVDHAEAEIRMGKKLIKGDEKGASKHLSILTGSRWFSNAFSDVDWSKIHEGRTATLQMFMSNHAISMWTYAGMLASTASYSKCKAVFEQPELVCLAFGMELGALLDQIVKVGLRKKAVGSQFSKIGVRIQITRAELARIKRVLKVRFGLSVNDTDTAEYHQDRLFFFIKREIRRNIRELGDLDRWPTRQESYFLLIRQLREAEIPPWGETKIAAFETINPSGTETEAAAAYLMLLHRVQIERYDRYTAITPRQEKGAAKSRSKIGIKQNMAEYWWGHHDSVLFCKTSEGLLLHVPQEHLLLAMQKEKSVILKKWPALIEGKRKRRIKKEKEKDLPPLEAPKESDILVLSEPKRRKINPQEESSGLPELPLEVQLKIIMFSSKPSPSVRKLILNIVKPNAEITVFSTELARPKLVWAWYAIVLGREPPKNLAQLWNYYVQEMGDPNAFVRKWYSAFVREYDVSRILRIYKKSYLKALSGRYMKGLQIHLMIEMLRGNTIGTAKTDISGVNDYQAVELIIAQVRIQLGPDRKFGKYFKKAVQHAMLLYGENNSPNVSLKIYEERHKDRISWRYEKWTGGEKSTEIREPGYPYFLRSETAKWISDWLNPILSSSWKVIRIIRGLGPTDVFSDMDYASLVWLIGVTMELSRQKPLSLALDGRWSTVHYRKKFLDKLQELAFKATALGRAVIHEYDEEKRIRELKMDHTESVWILAGGRRELGSDERKKEEAYEKENLSVLSANIDLVPGNDKIPYGLFNSITTYISNVMGYEDEEEEEDPPILEIMKALVQDGLEKNYSKDKIKEKILFSIKRFMKGGGWHGLSSGDFAKVEKDASVKIDLAWSMLVGKEKEVEIEEEEEEEEDDDVDDEREFQKKQAARDREYARLRRRDKELADKYDPKQKAALQAYKTAVEEAKQFITTGIKKRSESISNLKKFERKMDEFSSQLQVILVTKFKLGDLWNAAKKLGVTKKDLGTAPRTVHSNGIAAIEQSIKKKKADAEGGMSSSSTTITGKIGERYMHAIVTVDGSFVAAKIIGTSQDSLFRLAKTHVKNKGLGWDIKKPRSWFFNKENPMGPHITLREGMRKYVGEILQVEILNISHYVDPPSRWVVMNVELLPKKFKCIYGCHISIGQQRKSTQFWN